MKGWISKRRVVVALLLSGGIWLVFHIYADGRRAADALCGIAKPGMSIELVIKRATDQHVDFLDDRRYGSSPASLDGTLISLASPFTMRRTCEVTFRNGVVVRTANGSGPN